MTAPAPVLELTPAALEAARAALREGRSTGNPPLDHVVDALRRAWALTWARLRGAFPDLTEGQLDFAADRTVDVIASTRSMVLLVIRDAAKCAAARGPS